MSNNLPHEFGSYTLLKLLAKGGMGKIFLAKRGGYEHFEKFYALKRLLSKFNEDDDVKSRFIDEAKLGARLHHPNIVQIHELGNVDSHLYISTEFVDGFDLRRVLRFCHEKKKRIPLDIALFIVREVLSGLAYAHRQVDASGRSINLIHRDISPQNVLVSFEGEVKIIDFGLAKSTQRSKETQANVLLGNFGYMSPEQARGLDLDLRTDLYSTAIVLFELITGTKRFVDENPLRLLEMVARPTPIVPSDRLERSPRAIDRIYARATSAKRDKRPPSAEAFRDEVNSALHRLNPHASRENLAQFLSHLFLGGEAPPQVDNDILDRSMAMKVSVLLEQSAAFTSKKQEDVANRQLTGFEDEGIQTGSNDIMRAARVGDTFTHEELTGESEDSLNHVLGAGVSEDTQAMPAALPQDEPPPTFNEQASAVLVDDEVLSDEPLVDDEPTVVGASHPQGPPSFEMAEPDDAGEDAIAAAQTFGNPIQNAAGKGPAIHQAETGTYEAPQWSGTPTHSHAAPLLTQDEQADLREEKAPEVEQASMMVDFGDDYESEDLDALPMVQANLVDDSESLVIDFDVSDEPEQAPALEELVEVPDGPSQSNPGIRPAAKPLGKVAGSQTVGPRRRRRKD